MRASGYSAHSSPLLIALATDLASYEMATKFDSTLLQFLNSLSSDFIAVPLSDVLSAICLPVAALAMKETVDEITVVDSPISESLLT